jgi:hypothetical protein
MRRNLALMSTGSRSAAVASAGLGRAGGQVRQPKCRKMAAGMKRVRAA